MAKDETEIGITGLPIPKKRRSPRKQYEFEKKRRQNLGRNVGGVRYSSDVNPYVNPRAIREKTFDEFMAEIYLLTSTQKKSESSKSSKPKRDPYGEDPEVTRKRLKAKQKTQSESMSHFERMAKYSHEKTVAAKKAKHREKPLRPGEDKKYVPKTGTYVSNLPPAPEQPKPLRPGEVRTFNKQTQRWESNKD